MPRPKIPLISRRSAVRSALQIIDAEGIDGFSLDKLARHMGVKTPSLYHHFKNRSDLLSETAREILTDIPLGADPRPEEWQEWFVALSMRTYHQIMAHPRAAKLLLTHFPATMVMPGHERGAQILAGLGIPDRVHYPIIRGLERSVIGMALAAADDFAAGHDNPVGEIDDARWPTLSHAIAANRMTHPQIAEFTIRTFLAGVAGEYLEADRPTGT